MDYHNVIGASDSGKLLKKMCMDNGTEWVNGLIHAILPCL